MVYISNEPTLRHLSLCFPIAHTQKFRKMKAAVISIICIGLIGQVSFEAIRRIPLKKLLHLLINFLIKLFQTLADVTKDSRFIALDKESQLQIRQILPFLDFSNSKDLQELFSLLKEVNGVSGLLTKWLIYYRANKNTED